MERMEEPRLKVIARIYTEYPQKFGIPRQSGMETETEATIVFEPPYRNPDALRGLESFSHIWVLWQFSKAVKPEGDWSPTVRPPRLGGNRRMGVFATRSPYRPNAIGLSSLKLKEVVYTKNRGPVLKVLGADILDGTPIYDIKPYLAFTDSHPDAVCGFADAHLSDRLEVVFSERASKDVSLKTQEKLKSVLKMDPRPSYQNDPQRVYKMTALGFEISFCVKEQTLTVLDLKGADSAPEQKE